MDNYELEIQKILNEIDYTEYKPLNEYQKETEYAVELIYEPFLRYPENTENWNKCDTAGSLSKYILWGKYTSLQKCINDYKKIFKLA